MGRPTTGGGTRPTVGGGGTVASSDSKVWADTPTQVKFRESVLNAAIRARLDKKKTQYESLKSSELEKVPGTSVKVAIVAAVPAGKFLAAAKKALSEKRLEAQRRTDAADKDIVLPGDDTLDEDILATVDVRISGYRSVSTEKNLWLGYFKGYYNTTAEKRSEFKDPHGEAAVKYMVSYISGRKAPPGFSHHTEGVSIDFYQKRKKGRNEKWIKNSTKAGMDEGRLAWWYSTWFYTWIRDNAGTYGFTELNSEAWHYDYGH